jgi:hypothetical protein
MKLKDSFWVYLGIFIRELYFPCTHFVTAVTLSFMFYHLSLRMKRKRNESLQEYLKSQKFVFTDGNAMISSSGLNESDDNLVSGDYTKLGRKKNL